MLTDTYVDTATSTETTVYELRAELVAASNVSVTLDEISFNGIRFP
jgi:hypothetical protein